MGRYLLLWLLGIPIPISGTHLGFWRASLIEVGKRALNATKPARAIRCGQHNTSC